MDMCICAPVGKTRGAAGHTGEIPGILPISPISVRFCLRSRGRGKSYHRLIVLAVECLIVLVGYTSKWQALEGSRRQQRLGGIPATLRAMRSHCGPCQASGAAAPVLRERGDWRVYKESARVAPRL